MNGYLLCSNCTKDANLALFIERRGSPGHCSLCTLHRVTVVPAHSVANLFKALIRYHYNELEYNPLLGGNISLIALLRAENPIIKTDTIARAEAPGTGFSFDQFVSELTYPPQPDEATLRDAGVWLYADEKVGENVDFFSQSLQEQRDPRIAELGEKLTHTNYYALEELWRETLNDLLLNTAEIITLGRDFHRARIGVEGEFERADYRDDYVVRPYVGAQLAAPPQSKATSGRLNRANIAYLYLASNSPTAIAEVRPHPGHIVSVGRFAVNRELRVAGLANVSLLPFANNALGLEQFVLLKTIEHAFATPVTPDNTVGYLATQFLADIIRQLGYDGVTYRSSIGSGTNMTVFDPAALTYVPKSAAARRVMRVTYEYESVEVDMKRDTESIYTPLKRLS